LTALFGRDVVALKELRGMSRRWQTYVGRCLFVGLTAYLLYEYWRNAWLSQAGSRTVSVSEYAALGRAIFTRCDYVSLALTVLSAVIAGSDMLSREIRAGTLSLLLLTPLTPQRVILGKWKGAWMSAAALYLCSVPVLAIAVYLGGVGPEDLARSAVFTLGSASVAAALALYFSARLKSAGAAAAAAIPILFFILPACTCLDFLAHVFVEGIGGVFAHPGGFTTAAGAIVLTAVFLGRAVHQIRLRTGAIPGPADLARERRTLALDERREQRNSRPVRVLMRWRSVWDDNPLLWKEFTLRPALRMREDWRARCYILLFFFFISTWVATGFGAVEGFFAIWGTFFVIVALSSGCMLFAPEKENRQWLLLLSTPVSAAQIVRAKLVCGLIFPEALGLILLYLLALIAGLAGRPLDAILRFAGGASLFLLFCYALAAAASLRALTSRSAFVFSGCVVAALLTVPGLLSGALRPPESQLTPLAGEFWNVLESLDPLLVLSRILQWDRLTVPGSEQAAVCFLDFVMIYLPVTVLLPLEMVVRFRKIAIRA